VAHKRLSIADTFTKTNRTSFFNAVKNITIKRCARGSCRSSRSPPNPHHDGGYVYICGGPYDAAEELRTEFEGLVPDDVIEELENELF